jgi:AcrR family transcriptional regulator
MTESPLRAPVQARSRRSLEAIYAAAVTLLAEGGWDAVTVGEIERRSGVSRGTFYLRFSTRDDLVEYVYERLIAEVREFQDLTFGPHLTGPPLSTEEAARTAAGALAEAFRPFGRLMARSATLERPTSDAKAAAELGGHIAAVLRRGAPDADDLTIEFAVRLCFAAFVARQRSRAPFGEGDALPEDVFVEQLSLAVAAYLRAASS